MYGYYKVQKNCYKLLSSTEKFILTIQTQSVYGIISKPDRFVLIIEASSLQGDYEN